MSLPDFNIPLH